MYSVIVREKTSGKQLAKYTYEEYCEARERAADVAAVRIAQNHERVTVRVEKERD